MDASNVSNVTASNITNQTHGCRQSVAVVDQELANAEIGILAAILFFSLAGNSVLMTILLRGKRKLTRMLLFLFHISLADLLTALFTVLPLLCWKITGMFIGGDILCKAVKILHAMGWYASAFILMATAIDRFYAIFRPLHSQAKSTQQVRVVIGVTWCLSALLSGIQGYLFSHRCGSCYLTALTEPLHFKLYITSLAVVIWILPSLVLVATYAIISLIIWDNLSSKADNKRQSMTSGASITDPTGSSRSHSGRLTGSRSAPRTHVKRLSKSKVRAIVLTVVISVVYILCWTPYWVVTMWQVYTPKATIDKVLSDPVKKAVLAICQVLGNVNCCVNPFIYMLMIDKFRHKIASIVCLSGVNRKWSFTASTRTDHSSSRNTSSRTTKTTSTPTTSPSSGRHSTKNKCDEEARDAQELVIELRQVVSISHEPASVIRDTDESEELGFLD